MQKDRPSEPPGADLPEIFELREEDVEHLSYEVLADDDVTMLRQALRPGTRWARRAPSLSTARPARSLISFARYHAESSPLALTTACGVAAILLAAVG